MTSCSRFSLFVYVFILQTGNVHLEVVTAAAEEVLFCFDLRSWTIAKEGLVGIPQGKASAVGSL